MLVLIILWLLQKIQDKMSKLERVRTEATVLCDHKSMKERNLKNAWKKLEPCVIVDFIHLMLLFPASLMMCLRLDLGLYSVTTLPQPKSHPLVISW